GRVHAGERQKTGQEFRFAGEPGKHGDRRRFGVLGRCIFLALHGNFPEKLPFSQPNAATVARFALGEVGITATYISPEVLQGWSEGQGHVMPKQVMIVEDNELNMKLFRDLIEASGYSTIQTRNGMEALD